MPNKLIIVVHGIGNSVAGFENAWKDVIATNNDLTGVTVKGLLWEDVLQKVADKYDFVSGPLAEIATMCDFPQLQKLSGDSNWQLFKDYMMDVLVYVGLPDMWLMIQDECALKLAALRQRADGTEQFAKQDTILIGHSLGAGLLPHLTWREYVFTGAMAYRGLILLASPLGFESPNPKICKDFLQRMGEIFGGDRDEVLARFAGAWDSGGPNRLRFISNENDIVCSDVKYQIPGTGQLVDLIPLRQGFDPAETTLLNNEHADCVQWISFGQRDPAMIAANHEVLTYLKQDEFTKALKAML